MLGSVQSTVNYTYDGTWGDLLTGYNGKTITSDTIGNMLSDGTWTYTWEHGRELATMSNGSTTWTNTYNADGLRTKRTNGSTTYNYIYNGSSLSQMTVGSNTLYFAYDASGTPMSVTYNGTNYYYATNIQGDVTAILNSSGTAVVQYTYDAWGKILTTTGSMASTLGAHNPLRYRGYVYDTETTLYYLQSRYYNPAMGRFINADIYASTGHGVLGSNMFSYCLNNPIMSVDPTGEWTWVGAVLGGVTSAIGAIMNGGSFVEVLIETAIGFASGGCQSILGSFLSVIVETTYTIVTSDESDPIYLSLLLSIFSSQINGDNLNSLLKNALDSDTINMFDWVFGTGIDLCASGIDLLLQEFYGEDEKGIEKPELSPTTPSNSPDANPRGGGGRGGFGSRGSSSFAVVCMY